MRSNLDVLLKVFAIAVAFTSSIAAFGADEKKPAPATQPGNAVKKLTIEEFDKARQEKGAIILDVRSPQEFNQGHVPGAVNVPVAGPGSEEFEKRVGVIDRSKPVLIHCMRGTRSASACQKMEKMGFTQLLDFSGGFAAWKQASKPIEEGSRGGQLPPAGESEKK
jgi:rhodanese-related sulfurtransferase